MYDNTLIVEEIIKFNDLVDRSVIFFRASCYFWGIVTRSIWSVWLEITVARMQEEIYEKSGG